MQNAVLYGDGIHDDTQAIQSMLDTGKSCVYLPPPEKCYMISRPLVLGSNQELRMDRFTLIRLMPHSDCVMVTNRDKETGNRHLALTGGIWDFDNRNQGPNFMLQHIADPPLPRFNSKFGAEKYDPDLYRAEAMYFQNVTDMVVRGITIRNPGTYSIQFCKLSYFIIEDVEFDFTAWNPAKANMDGIHLDGGCHHGKIKDVRGTCFDDMIALNANDGSCAYYQGPITDIDIDGVYCEYCHSAVRLLSTGAEMKRVTIRNVHGNFYRYAIGVTHFFGNHRPTHGVFDDIVIEDCFFGKAYQPDDLWELLPNFALIYCDDRADVGSLTIRNIFRDEKVAALPCIYVAPMCKIEHLTLRDCKQINRLPQDFPFMEIAGTVEHLEKSNIIELHRPDPDWRKKEQHFQPSPYL